MNDTRTWMASVLFLDIIGYSKVPVNQQLDIKVHFNELVTKQIGSLDPNDCIRLDTGDGVAICYLGDPEKMYAIACYLRDAFVSMKNGAGQQYEVRQGLNLGAVKVVVGINNERNCVGVGINDAERIMSFAAPNQLLVSKSYFDVVNSLSAEYSSQLKHIGTRSDKHDKQHEVYELSVELVRVTSSEPANDTSSHQITSSSDGNALDAKTLEHLQKEYAKYVGARQAETILNQSVSQSGSLVDLCKTLTSHLESEDDRYHFEKFTSYYGYSGF